jgi:hypothetical protein
MKAIFIFLLFFSSILIKSQNVVKNYSDSKNVENIVLNVLNNVFHYDSINVTIINMHVEENTIISGYIAKDTTILHTYMIYVNSLSLNTYNKQISFIAHEMAHLRQMESGELIVLSNHSGVVFRGDTIYYDLVGYSNRPSEIDAIEQGLIIEDIINKL